MKTFLRQELERFLTALNDALNQSLEVVVIGGSAAALHYRVARATHDIDTWTNVGAPLAASPGCERRLSPSLARGRARSRHELYSRSSPPREGGDAMKRICFALVTAATV